MGPNVIVQRQSRHLLNMRNLVQETATPGTKSQERRTKDRRVARETARRHVRKSVYAEGTQHMASSSTPTRTHLPSTLKGGTQPQSTTQNRNSSTQEMSQESPAEQPENHCKSRNQLKIWRTNCSWKPAAGGDTSGAFQNTSFCLRIRSIISLCHGNSPRKDLSTLNCLIGCRQHPWPNHYP